MSLANYKKKRNFKKTSEPLPVIEKKHGARTFVIQRHKASRLHYDFRLEVNGVLKSWAVPKGPSLYPSDKRLAMMVEDHPLSYGSFKGTIPEGNYGAGIVEIWDHGTYEPEEMDEVSDRAIEKNIRKGMLKFTLKGRKLKGSFALVRIRGAESKNWLLIKHRDKYTTEDPYNSEDDTLATSPINKFLREQEPTKEPAKKSKGTVKSHTAKKTSSAKAGKAAAPRKSATAAKTVKKSAAKKSATKKSAAKKPATKKSATKKPATKKSAVTGGSLKKK